MKYMKSIIVVSFFLAASCAHKNKQVDQQEKQAKSKIETQAKADQSYICQVGKDKRKVSLVKNPKRCEVFYKKFGEKNQIAWAEATPSLCSEVYSKVRKNIESKGFKCMSENKQAEAKRETASAKE